MLNHSEIYSKDFLGIIHSFIYLFDIFLGFCFFFLSDGSTYFLVREGDGKRNFLWG